MAQKPTIAGLEGYCTIPEAAATLDLSVPSVYRLISEGKLQKYEILRRTILKARERYNLSYREEM